MLRGSDSETSSSEEEQCDSDTPAQSLRQRPVLQPPRLVMEQELSQILAAQEAQQQQVSQMLAQEVRQQADQMRLLEIQATTNSTLQSFINNVDRFDGTVGDLNHFLRSGDKFMARVADRERTGRLDPLDAEALKGALVLRVHRHILNRLQADEATPWADLRKRLQKEFGGGRWSPEEDALRMLRMVRGTRQTKGEFAAQLLSAFHAVTDKLRETTTGPEAAADLRVIEKLAKVQLGEVVGRSLTGSLVEEANSLIDAAGRGEDESDNKPLRPREWTAAPRRQMEVHRRREEPRPPRRETQWQSSRRNEVRRSGQPGGERRKEERKCYSCGRRGHIQATCPEAKCYECRTPGHIARNCPYMRPRRRTNQDEPMEVNHHRAGRRSRTDRKPGEQAREKGPLTDAGESDGGKWSESVSTTDDEGSLHSYATVVRSGQRSQERRPRSQKE